jgi:hypothetical protein
MTRLQITTVVTAALAVSCLGVFGSVTLINLASPLYLPFLGLVGLVLCVTAATLALMLLPAAISGGLADGTQTDEDAAWPAAPPVTWQPIATAPKDGTRIMICRNERIEVARWGLVGGMGDRVWLIGRDPCSLLTPPTHWRPLPAPPQDHPPEPSHPTGA